MIMMSRSPFKNLSSLLLKKLACGLQLSVGLQGASQMHRLFPPLHSVTHSPWQLNDE